MMKTKRWKEVTALVCFLRICKGNKGTALLQVADMGVTDSA